MRHDGIFWGDEMLYLDCGGRYVGICVYRKSNFPLKWLHFTVYKLYLNKVYFLKKDEEAKGKTDGKTQCSRPCPFSYSVLIVTGLGRDGGGREEWTGEIDWPAYEPLYIR